MKLLPYDIFKPVSGYEDLYEVSNMGRVKSLSRKTTAGMRVGRILKPNKKKTGYLQVVLCMEGELKSFLVHRLVAQAFIPNPDNLSCVNHKDENKENNRVENLEWITLEDNFNYGTARARAAKTLSIKKMGVYNTKLSKPVYQYTLNGEFVREWSSTKEIQRQTGWYQSHVSQCCNGKRNSAYGFRWSFSPICNCNQVEGVHQTSS